MLNSVKILLFTKQIPILREKVEFYQVKPGDMINTHVRKGKLIIHYFHEQWILHELGHVAAASLQNLKRKNYNLPIGESYSYKELRDELIVFQHQVTLNHHIGIDNLSKAKIISIEAISGQIDASLNDKTMANKLKSILPCFLEPYDFNFTMKLIQRNLERL